MEIKKINKEIDRFSREFYITTSRLSRILCISKTFFDKIMIGRDITISKKKSGKTFRYVIATDNAKKIAKIFINKKYEIKKSINKPNKLI